MKQIKFKKIRAFDVLSRTAVALLLALLGASHPSLAATGSSQPSQAATGSSHPSPAAAGSTNAVEVLAPKSVFQDDLKNGKDPFFPRSTRRGAKTPETTAVAVPVVQLFLKGITGPPQRRFALINNQTLSAGETASVRVAQGQIKVRCLEIRADSVLISVEGNPEQKELKLRGQ